MKNYRLILILGDVFSLALVTVIGFATHGQTDLALLPRMMTTFLPLLAGWFLLAPFLNLFNPETTQNPRQLWRPVYVVVLTAPLMAVLRAVMLNGIALPLFVLIMAASTALGMLLWRIIFIFIQRRLSLVQ
ncbi:MAG: DUF3054 domain-containing protein [Anaerolineales bacterium]